MVNVSGKLYIVSTPIGNLLDITFRAIEVLKTVDMIAAEDTRHTVELLNYFEIKTKLISYHEHNKAEKTDIILSEICKGSNVAIVTDAGTPLISDPGDMLVESAIENNIEIVAIPGPCAAINALVLSGIDASGFCFVGFLSEDKKKRKMQFRDLSTETKTMIFYISPHNLKSDLSDIIAILGKDRKASISREMTKKFEETKRGTLETINNYYIENQIRGEFVLVVAGIDRRVLDEQEKKDWLKLSLNEHIDYYVKKGFTEKDAMKKVAKDRNIKKNEVYAKIKIKESINKK